MKKGQSSLEFFAVYGWVFLVIMVVFCIFTYLEFLDANQLKPELCILPAGLTCMDSSYNEGKFSFIMKNNLGREIILSKIEADGCETSRPSCVVEDGQQVPVSITCGELKGNLKVSYENVDTRIEHIQEGQASSPEKAPESEPDDTYYNICKNANNNGICETLELREDGLTAGECCAYWKLCCNYC